MAQDIKDTLNLQGVEVVAQKPVVKMTTDKMTYNVQQDPDSKTMTLLDMLRKVPMVTVDGQDNVSVKGSSNFKVYVDGKPNQMFQSNLSQIAKSIPASMVQSVEVISSPGAKYDAEGTMGVLDIKMLHNNSQGLTDCSNCYNGNMALYASTKGVGASSYVGGQQGKFTYSVDAFTQWATIKDFNMENTRVQSSADGLSSQVSSMNNTVRQPFTMGTLTLGYAIDSLRSIGASVGVSGGAQNNNFSPTMAFQGGIYGTGFRYQYDLSQHSRFMGTNASADYQRWLNAGHTSSFILSYLYDYNPARNRTRTLYNNVGNVVRLTLNNLFSDSHTWGTSHTVQGDFTLDLGQGQTLETGAKFISRRNKSDNRFYDVEKGVDVFNADNSINYRNLQNIVAGYAQYKIAKEKFNARLGLRYEHTFESVKYRDRSERDFHKDYGNLVPSASTGYNLTPTSNIGLTYTMRISRPDISQLNPYTDRTDPTALSYGSPSLAVVKAHDISLAYNFFSPKFMFNASLSQDYSGNEIENYSFVDKDNKYNTTYANNGRSSMTFLSAFVRFVMSKTTTIMFNGKVGYGDWKAKEAGLHNWGWGGNGYLGLEQQLPWEIKGTAGIFARTRDYNLMGYGSSSMHILTLSLTRTFLKDRLELSARYINPFGKRLTIKTLANGKDFSNLSCISFPLQMGMISVKWNFGNTKKQFNQYKSNIKNDFNDARKKEDPTSGIGM
ncbi:TonB-dependent receptor [Hallella multisaccharivorax DSM 17128]|nr:TonB-dependent receptor [Hallella multisaccharivorax DSM 17128]